VHLTQTVPELSLQIYFLIAVIALLSATLHGAIGLAGGIMLAAMLSHMIGIKSVVPALTVSLLISHASRIFLHFNNIDWQIAKRVLLFGLPMVVIGAWLFTHLNEKVIAFLFAAFLISSFPIKRWAKRNNLNTGPKLLAGASMVWGLIAGNVIGPGFFLSPFLLGTGMSRLTFIGTIAVITLFMNIVKLSVFGAADLMTSELFFLGVFMGLIMIPGNWIGKKIARRLSDLHHQTIIDVLTVVIIVNFLYLGFA